MKTKELIRKIELIGYGAEEVERVGEVRVFHNGFLCATVSVSSFLSLDTHHFMFDELVESEREALYNLLDEYARTPVEDREEEEKYYYRFPHYNI